MKVTQDEKGRFIIDGPITANEMLDLAAKHYWGELKNSPIKSATDAVNFLQAKLAKLEHEVFAVLFLNQRHEVIFYDELFRGTVNAAAVYPREVMKEALQHNACALLFAHNHPSGDSTPSRADEEVTKRLVDAAELLEIRVLDHIIIGGGVDAYTSFVEMGLM